MSQSATKHARQAAKATSTDPAKKVSDDPAKKASADPAKKASGAPAKVDAAPSAPADNDITVALAVFDAMHPDSRAANKDYWNSVTSGPMGPKTAAAVARMNGLPRSCQTIAAMCSGMTGRCQGMMPECGAPRAMGTKCPHCGSYCM